MGFNSGFKGLNAKTAWRKMELKNKLEMKDVKI